MRNSLLQAQISEKELGLVRAQHNELYEEATEFRTKMKKVLVFGNFFFQHLIGNSTLGLCDERGGG